MFTRASVERIVCNEPSEQECARMRLSKTQCVHFVTCHLCTAFKLPALGQSLLVFLYLFTEMSMPIRGQVNSQEDVAYHLSLSLWHIVNWFAQTTLYQCHPVRSVKGGRAGAPEVGSQAWSAAMPRSVHLT